MPGRRAGLGERPVGRLGSSVVSPTLGPIGLALVRREAEPGATVTVGEQGASAVVVELPFAIARLSHGQHSELGDPAPVCAG